ncbi:FOG: Transposon-encoded proteins with TYA, reverse transcriptase, integrase domains in various combinations [Plasmopara halstedii]|uniref:FOG: Transposon-encoded proteins with TYA, reverse transcriptase, integrase domains in various combinations n=1 Tax=Plasmopara halstedii TaxID=4781 RepID=A0A0P1AYR4_PLAHL|nr:FOG: Transposon-encoded proteins with TYA, reverse transcriptase, integrase domains in various combinations [Plasmopara halstedii]CEG46816.1 FOG: Transposon-encoded proteins with TYA, reverse transcriptase, integrase domains in various combinations [Plasmopara halstedii]|eukprot:XP_024583185.1 FOG: Transposon-encoded proteins with TYA, reverse transcriptase, integrase domains in various combinations [Plasmopara halstedii]
MTKGLWDAAAGAETLVTKKQQSWSTLDGFHQTRYMADRLQLEEKFSSFKYTAANISKHVMELEQLVMEMKSANCSPSEEDICATLLRSLPGSFESLVVQAFRMAVMHSSFANLVSKLIAGDVRQKESSRIGKMTRSLSTRRKCGKKGHYASDCRSSGKGSGGSTDQSNVALNVTESMTNMNQIMDSRASAHICKERNAYINYMEESTERNVTSAKSGAKLEVLGYGSSG